MGRYYNSFAKLLNDYDEEIDFVVHLGDYIYETTGGSNDLPPDSDRKIEFEDIEGAIPIGDPDDPRYAASSLANYRTIYKTYRSDEMFQQVHERWPMMVIWDDHEFSNDSWGATATYTNGWRESLPLWDPEDRLGSTAKMLSNALLNRDLKNRYRIIKDLIDDFSADGVVLHSDRSCKPYSVGQYDLKDELTARLGVRVAVIEADHADPRQFAEEQIETRLQAFMESFG